MLTMLALLENSARIAQVRWRATRLRRRSGHRRTRSRAIPPALHQGPQWERAHGVSRTAGPVLPPVDWTHGIGFRNNWLRVSGTTEMPQVDKRICHQLHAIVPLLDELEPQQQPFEFILPREGPLHA